MSKQSSLKKFVNVLSQKNHKLGRKHIYDQFNNLLTNQISQLNKHSKGKANRELLGIIKTKNYFNNWKANSAAKLKKIVLNQD